MAEERNLTKILAKTNKSTMNVLCDKHLGSLDFNLPLSPKCEPFTVETKSVQGIVFIIATS